MKYLILMTIFMLGFPSLVMADPVKTQPGTTMRELPGNAYIVEGRGNDTIRIDGGGESILYRSLFGRYPDRNAYHGGAPQSDVNQICGGTMSVSDRNRCIKDYMDEREKLMKKYNN